MAQNLKIIQCSVCFDDVDVDIKTDTVICASCTARQAAPPETPKYLQTNPTEPKLTKSGKPRAKRGEGKKYQSSGRKRGWHFKVFYRHSDGTCYHRGKLITDVAEIAKWEQLSKDKDSPEGV